MASINNPPAYQKTPEGIMYILNLFSINNLSYILFKCEHIFTGQNKNLDILFETDQDYNKASRMLEQDGFIIQLSEKVEKYKTMYTGFYNNILYSIHLHREVAWHGMKALDKAPLFKNKKITTPLIIIPSIEDSILIHSAHILFENFKITEKEKPSLDQINSPNINHKYLTQQVTKNHWKDGFELIIKNKEKKYPLSKKDLFKIWTKKLIQEPTTTLYLTKKIIKKAARSLNPQRKGRLIAFIGVNGSGKSTLTRKLMEQYQQPIQHVGKKQSYYYFGWKPTFSLTKYLSKRLEQKEKKIFLEINLKQEKKEKRFQLKQELLFIYLTFEFYYRYRKEILPKLRQNEVVICDRYFYDIYGQYPYAKRSIIIKPLLKIFPKPDFLYILDTEEELLQKRGKTDKTQEQNIVKQTQRKILPKEYLQEQRKNFRYLSKYLKGKIINTGNDINQCTKQIINETWTKIAKP